VFRIQVQTDKLHSIQQFNKYEDEDQQKVETSIFLVVVAEEEEE